MHPWQGLPLSRRPTKEFFRENGRRPATGGESRTRTDNGYLRAIPQRAGFYQQSTDQLLDHALPHWCEYHQFRSGRLKVHQHSSVTGERDSPNRVLCGAYFQSTRLQQFLDNALRRPPYP